MLQCLLMSAIATLRLIVRVAAMVLVTSLPSVPCLAAQAAAVIPGSSLPPDRLRAGSLLLQPCEIGPRAVAGIPTAAAYCTAFDVPEDWDTPSGRHIKLRVAVVRSNAVRSERDPVVFLDGGPGGAATEDYAAIANALTLLTLRRDILLIDQRGTGGSNALDCRDRAGGQSPPVSAKPTEITSSVQLLQQCLAAVRSHAAPEHYTTGDAIRDLEAVRQALGAPQLNLLGTSYGTRVAQQYAARYPGAVRSIVLDSAIPNSLALGSEHARNLELALQSLFTRCDADPACKRSFGDSYANLNQLRDRLRAQPQAVTLRDPSSFELLHLQFSAEDLAAIVRVNAYSSITADLLPLMLHQAVLGNYEPLLAQKRWLTDDLGSQISGGMELSVICAEDADLLVVRPEDAATLLGSEQVTRIQSACAIWPRGSRRADFHTAFASPLPVLILAGQYDPVTPPSYGADLLRTLPDARLLVAPGRGHGVLGAGCIPRLVNQFIDELKPQALDDRCLRQLVDTPAFIDFNGTPP
jgi:pimeloyl-ACP methyl ester carboxylesterase